MAFHLYSGPDAWILVPECMRASSAADAAHGPLSFVARADPGSLTFDEVADIARQFDSTSYAIVSEELGRRLRGAA
jgi:hypothetical protein